MEAYNAPQIMTAIRPDMLVLQVGLFLSLLLAVSFYDLKHRLIPDKLNTAIALTVLFAFSPRHLLGVFGALPYLLVLLVSKDGNGMGGGDVKLVAACGMVLGLPASLTASVLGLSLFLLVCGTVTIKRKLRREVCVSPFPAGPFLAVGAAIAYFMKVGGYSL